MGLQELSANWLAVKSTQPITNLLWDWTEDIRALVAYNKLEKENTGLKQGDRMVTLLCSQLACFT